MRKGEKEESPLLPGMGPLSFKVEDSRGHIITRTIKKKTEKLNETTDHKSKK